MLFLPSSQLLLEGSSPSYWGKHANQSISVQKTEGDLLSCWYKSLSYDSADKATLKAGILVDHSAKLRPVFHKAFSSTQKISQIANEEVFIAEMPKSGADLNEFWNENHSEFWFQLIKLGFDF